MREQVVDEIAELRNRTTQLEEGHVTPRLNSYSWNWRRSWTKGPNSRPKTSKKKTLMRTQTRILNRLMMTNLQILEIHTPPSTMTRKGPYVRNPKRRAEAARIKMMVERRVNKVLAEYEANRLANESSGTNNGSHGNAAKGCSFKAFLSCHPHKFQGTEGAVGLLR
ncbi:hypothetical protein E3N88_07518 [Mikania micrantha]|uniref:Uncharacterized protein n=1 Tax=Mikania micrantha TaxID=192012 RepID=A0A5N6PST5_9ASTR|nr:hypothetical protein E3N88_07518 [Mikania micrantha]